MMYLTATLRNNRRGVAMLLVLISLMMATVLTSAYLASRDNSTAIGDNVASAAAARWAADSGLDFGVAILQNDCAWRTSHINGRLLSNYPLGGGTLNLDLLDIATGQAPGSNTEYVRMTATADVGGVNQTAVANCRVPLDTSPTADVDLSEFAVFAATSLQVKNQGTVSRWPKAPLSSLGERVLIGTRAASASSIALTDTAASIDSTVYSGPGASAMLISVATGQMPENKQLLDQIPFPASPSSGVAAPLIISLSPNLTMSGGSAITNVTTRWNNVELKNTATRTLRGNITAVTDGDLYVHDSSKIIIDGAVKLVVFGNLQLDTGSIELKNGASLTMFVRGNGGSQAIDIKDGYVGELRATNVRDASGAAPYMDPDRLVIFSTPGAAATPWRIEGNSVVKGSLYAPDPSQIEVTGISAVYGRVAGRDIRIDSTSCLFYDPSLNTHAGYTEPTSPVFDNTGHIKTQIKTLASLDTSLLQTVADTIGLLLSPLSRQNTTIKPTGYMPPSGGSVAVTDPTPRTIHIEHELVTFGNALDSWE